MVKLAYHASHEQFPPSRLLKLAILAEQAGFDSIHSSDHFNPWSHRQGNSAFAFSWVSSVLQATSIPVSMICIPGQRYHPAIVAQAIATIADMYPERYAVEMATGEALNETITGEPWPSKDHRNQRLQESVDVIRKMLKGEEVNYCGMVTVKHARIWSLPASIPPIYCAAISPETSKWSGAWADGLITTSGSPEDITEKMNAFYEGGGKGKPVSVQYSFSYAATREEALTGAHDQWRSNLVSREKLGELSTTEEFDRETDNITREEVAKQLPLITNMEQLFDEIRKMEATGVNMISLHNVNRNHEEFVEQFRQYKR